MKKNIIIATIVLVILAAIIGFVGAVTSKFALFNIFLALAPIQTVLPPANILVLGVDAAFGHRSDTIMVLHTNPNSQSVSLISIPRDTLVVIPGRGLDKINHAYAYGGAELARQTVASLLDTDLTYYIVINLSGIVQIIDELGGLELEVDKRMYYVDQAGELYIDLQPGLQRLTGQQVMGYLRYRREGGDFTRINRQQNFLRALALEMMKRNNLLQSPKLFLDLLAHLETNLNSQQVVALCLGVRSTLETNRLRMTTVPGVDLMVDGIYYWRPNSAALQSIVAQYLQEGQPTLSHD